MKKLIKLALLVGIVLFALINYRIFSFNKGIHKTDLEDKSISKIISSLANIQKVEYYEKTIPSEEFTHKVYILTSEDAYLFDATENDINIIKGLSILSKNKPEKISPIPFYVEIIAGIIVIATPFGKKED